MSAANWAISVSGLGKRYTLGETHAGSLRDRLATGIQRLAGRRSADARRTPEEFWALRDVSFDLAQGEALGIVGGNGAGKSTLLKVLSRITPPTTGTATVRGRLASLLEVGTGFHPELTGRENVFLNGAILGMRTAEVRRKFDEIVAFAGVEKFIDTPVKRYSSGMYVRLAFAVAAHLETDVLIVDEVLAVGDAEFQKRCLGKMSEVTGAGRTVLFVSHNMAAVQKLCPRALWMRNGSVAEHGASADVIAAYLAATFGIDGGGHCPPEFVYKQPDKQGTGDAAVTSVQLLQADGQPASFVSTWDSVVFRIGFECRRPFRSFAAELHVTSLDGAPLIRTSTSPDHTVCFGVSEGEYTIDCSFPKLPLAAGEYRVGVDLAIPGIEYVVQTDDLFRLRVESRDVYSSGFVPSSNRTLIASEHQWSPPCACADGNSHEAAGRSVKPELREDRR